MISSKQTIRVQSLRRLITLASRPNTETCVNPLNTQIYNFLGVNKNKDRGKKTAPLLYILLTMQNRCLQNMTELVGRNGRIFCLFTGQNVYEMSET